MRSSSVAHASRTHVPQLCTAILQYLASHPSAADTVEGVLACWLPQADFPDAAEHIDAALAALVSEKRLRACRLPDGNILYRAMPKQ